MVFGIGKKSGEYASSSDEKRSPHEEGQKDPFTTTQRYGAEAGVGKDGLTDPNDVGHSLHRGLSARQITMIAIGGESRVGRTVWVDDGRRVLMFDDRRHRNWSHHRHGSSAR